MDNGRPVSMMSGQSLDVPQSSSKSFWDIGNYRRVVERIDNGAILSDDFMEMVRQRASIEKEYSKKLASWSKHWGKHMDKSEEFGTLKQGFGGMFQEADDTSTIHHNISQSLTKGVEEGILDWKNEKYKRALAIMNWKESKLASENFEKAQKQWAKLKLKVDKYKKSYHSSVQVYEKNFKLMDEINQGNYTEEDKQKQIVKLRKAENDRDEARSKYEKGLDAIEKEKPEYVRAMTTEFERCQANEKDRIEFFKKMLQFYHDFVNISRLGSFGQGYEKLQTALSGVESDADLELFSRSKGADMEMEWPHFEDYGEGLDVLSHRSSIGSSDQIGGSMPMRPPPMANVRESVPENEWSDDEQLDPQADGPRFTALYDYDARDNEELTLRAGDIVVQTQSEDQDGWCMGILNGKEGLYPANYVEPC